jgi:putative transposase
MHYTDRIEPRKRLRLLEYDYRMGGYYYVTLCTQNRQCLFGKIENCMALNDAGLMVHNIWLDIGNKYDGFENDLFVVMPNHLHGILIIRERGPARGPAPTLSLPDVMRNFKSLTTTFYMKGVEENQFEPFEKRLWQRSYYEHIIRKNESLEKIRQYIVNNPGKWEEDRENPRFM